MFNKILFYYLVSGGSVLKSLLVFCCGNKIEVMKIMTW